jgi:lysylphosphatidylglycerol synthetase-like protein (DUF2156 family)
MYHRQEKLQQMSIISLCAAIILGLFGLFKSFHLFIYLALYCLSVGIMAEALLFYLTYRKMDAVRIILPGILLFILTTYLFFKFLKGS